MWTICRKELADHFSSTRFLILFWCIVTLQVLLGLWIIKTVWWT